MQQSENIQNNYIKFTGFTFRLDVTRFLLQRKFFKPENPFAVYELTYTPLAFPALELHIKWYW